MTHTDLPLFAPKRMGRIHAAKLSESQRLQRLLAVLQRGGWWGTRALVVEADVMAVGTGVAELRANGIAIETRCQGIGRYEYRLISPSR